MPFAVTWVDLQIITLSELGQTKANIAYMCNLKLKNNTNELIHKTETDVRTDYGYQGEKQIATLGLTCTHCYS